MKRYRIVQVLVALICCTVAAPAFAVEILSIGNGLQTVPVGSYLEAQNIADTLVFTSIDLQATNSISFINPVDLSTSSYGTPVYPLTLFAPTLNINYNLVMGPSSHLELHTNTINLGGNINQTPDKIASSATNVQTLNNNVDLQQALDLTSPTAPSTVTAGFGNSNSLTFNNDTTMNLSGGLLSGTVNMANQDSLLNLIGYDFQLNTGSGFQPIGSGSISATSGDLEGFLNSQNSFQVSFNQDVPGQINLESSGMVNVAPVPEPGTLLLLGIGLVALGLISWRRRWIS